MIHCEDSPDLIGTLPKLSAEDAQVFAICRPTANLAPYALVCTIRMSLLAASWPASFVTEKDEAINITVYTQRMRVYFSCYELLPKLRVRS